MHALPVRAEDNAPTVARPEWHHVVGRTKSEPSWYAAAHVNQPDIDISADPTKRATGVTLPAQQLIGFARVELEPGASQTVTFVVPMSLLAYTGASDDLVIEPGLVEVSVGSSSSDIRSTVTLTVTGKTRVIKSEDRAFLSVATLGS